MPNKSLSFIIVFLLCAGASWGQPMIVTTSPLPNGAVGSPYNQQLTANGGFPPYSWSIITGTLPNGLMLSSAGIISGTPTSPGPATFTIFVKDLDGANTNQQFTLG